ncbi:MAG: diguanylate cyclase [Gammaproteobacteria bacterium]|nr:diguanylate cyclase [Gammaproteobacteria bacterium]
MSSRESFQTIKPVDVLLIEDNSGDARLVREFLAEAAQGVFSVAHHALLGSALEDIADRSFDVVLADMSLPDGEGMEIISRLQEAAPGLPIVVLTGAKGERRAMQAVQLGVQDYLIKGQCDGNLLVRALKYAIERKRGEERLAYLAHYDVLTGLPNRILFRERLERAISRSHRSQKPVALALMFLDLDHFKQINDGFGHDFGDKVLKEVAVRLQKCVRESDTVARLGGDEFTVILEDISTEKACAVVAQKMIDMLTPALEVDGHKVTVTPSIGIGVYPRCGETAEDLIKCADSAMYEAKENGRATFRYAGHNFSEHTQDLVSVLRSLTQALAADQLQVRYVPVVDARTGLVNSLDSLMFWSHPKDGWVELNGFLDFVDESELNWNVGEWWLRKVCQDISGWRESGISPMPVNVAISSWQFCDRNLPKLLLTLFESAGIEGPYLQLSITERALLESQEVAHDLWASLRGLGVRLALSHYGKGASSISWFGKMQFDTLIIDADFSGIVGDRVLQGMVSFGNALGSRVMAQGVEDPSQISLLQKLGFDYLTGPCFGSPRVVNEVTQMWSTKPPLISTAIEKRTARRRRTDGLPAAGA